jgi:hypothetical protein
MANGSAGRLVQLITAPLTGCSHVAVGPQFTVHRWTVLDTLVGAARVFCLLCGVVAAVIGHRKNLSVGQSFALGFFLGPYGVASVVSEKPGFPQAPSGMRAVKCPRCNAVQNIDETQAVYECSQCKTVNSARGRGGGRAVPVGDVRVVRWGVRRGAARRGVLFGGVPGGGVPFPPLKSQRPQVFSCWGTSRFPTPREPSARHPWAL